MTPSDQSYCEIPLSQGQFALVDAEDFEAINQHKWYAWWSKFTKSFYAVRSVRVRDGQKYTVYMHRFVLGLEKGDKVLVDHKEPSQTLDNRKGNLRKATAAQNQRNSRRPKTNTSGYKGVHWCNSRKKWIAQASVNNRRVYIGRFDCPSVAHVAYAHFVTSISGDFSRAA